MSLFQSALDSATITLDSTLEVECQKILEASKLTIATVETVSSGVIGKFLQAMRLKTDNYLGTVSCNHPKMYKKIFDLNVSKDSPFSKSQSIVLAKEVAKLLEADIGLSCIGMMGFPDENGVRSAKVLLGYYVNKNERIKVLEIIGDEQQILKQVVQASVAFLKDYCIKFTSLN